MKRLISTLTACLALFGAGHAQVSDVKLGYCPEQLPGSTGISWTEANSDVSVAMMIPEGTISTYSGNNIAGINAGLSSRLNIESMTVWIRSSLDGQNLAEKTITPDSDPKLAKGWNTVYFDTPWEIPEKPGPLYFGYTYHQKGAAFGVAAVETPNENAFFVKFGSGEWEDRSDRWSACVQALVQGDKLPKINLSLTSVTLPETFILRNGTLEVTGVVKNLATYTVSGFDVTASDKDGNALDTKHVDMSLAYGESKEFTVTFDIPAEKVTGETFDVNISIGNIPEGQDEDLTDNVRSGSMSVVTNDFTHRILVEEFTTEKCPNCPRVGTYLHDALEKPEFAENVIAVCHHSGYYTDFFTSSFDNEYLWLFNAGGATYAPAIMVDRRTVSGTATPVFCPGSQNELEQAMKRQMNKPAFVSLDIKMELADWDNVKVKVQGECSVDDLCDEPRITVYVVEDNLKAISQANATNWIHQHVNRAVNATWGEPIEFVDGQYEYECTLRLNKAWDRNNLKIVAFINKYNRANAEDCPIFNAAEIKFEVPDGIDETFAADADTEAEYFTLEGIRVENPTGGLFIRRQGAKAEKILVK